jgi:FtsP/CotA-like multicopper oxidase with cupredoxin domain
VSGPGLDRRTLLAAAAALPFARSTAARAEPLRLRAAPARVALVGEGWPSTEVWAYGGTVPGPILRGRQGERLVVEVENGLPEPTTVHWHGLRVPVDQDGVPGTSQPPIPPGGRFRYELPLRDAGTFWYHPHLRSAEQVGRGLYGLLVVDEPGPPPFDRDLPLVLDDWRLRRDAVNDVRANRHDAAHAGALGNTVTVNGRVVERLEVRPGERLRLRLLNAANARIFALRFKGADPWLLALDGHPLPPRVVDEPLFLAPGQRADLVLDVPPVRLARIDLLDEGDPQGTYRVTSFAVTRNEPVPHREPAGPPPALPANPLPEPDLANAERHELVLDGGAMASMMRGRVPPTDLPPPDPRALRTLFDRGLFWTIDGRATAEDGHAHEPPLLRLALGRSHRLAIVNRTAFAHPIHLHGHSFRVLARDGREEPDRPWRDTVLVAPGERVEVAFVADNPGLWMLHCHVLEHQGSGMMALVEVG